MSSLSGALTALPLQFGPEQNEKNELLNHEHFKPQNVKKPRLLALKPRSGVKKVDLVVAHELLR